MSDQNQEDPNATQRLDQEQLYREAQQRQARTGAGGSSDATDVPVNNLGGGAEASAGSSATSGPVNLRATEEAAAVKGNRNGRLKGCAVGCATLLIGSCLALTAVVGYKTVSSFGGVTTIPPTPNPVAAGNPTAVPGGNSATAVPGAPQAPTATSEATAQPNVPAATRVQDNYSIIVNYSAGDSQTLGNLNQNKKGEARPFTAEIGKHGSSNAFSQVGDASNPQFKRTATDVTSVEANEKAVGVIVVGSTGGRSLKAAGAPGVNLDIIVNSTKSFINANPKGGALTFDVDEYTLQFETAEVTDGSSRIRSGASSLRDAPGEIKEGSRATIIIPAGADASQVTVNYRGKTSTVVKGEGKDVRAMFEEAVSNVGIKLSKEGQTAQVDRYSAHSQTRARDGQAAFVESVGARREEAKQFKSGAAL